MTTDTLNSRLLILGIGNLLLRDEGVGVHAIQALATKSELPLDVDLIDGGTAGLDLIDCLADRQKVVVIDAIDAGVAPGTILKLQVPDLIDDDSLVLSAHETGFLAAMKATRLLGCPPTDVTVFGVQTADMSSGLELSAPVAAQMPQLLAIVLEECRSQTIVVSPAEADLPSRTIGTGMSITVHTPSAWKSTDLKARNKP